MSLCFVSDNHPHHVADSLFEVEKGKILEPKIFVESFNNYEGLEPELELLT